MQYHDQDRYFDHDADMGIIGRGNSIEACFVDAAESVFGLMTDLKKINPKKTIKIEFDETDVELALVTWINLLIAHSKIQDLVYCSFTLKRNNHHWAGTASGEYWRDEIERGIEVKGATLTLLSVKQYDSQQWEAKCVVDV